MNPTISVCIVTLLFLKIIFVCLVSVFVHAHLMVRGQFVGLGFLLLLCVAQVLNLGDQGFWALPLPTETSWSSVCITEYLACSGHVLFVGKCV